ncbi:uncharacterized protein tp53i13 [Myripristis murdjan]|uniref:Tumor protein p53-inducible protein 13 n=1 Tax=Myripristis murdjan TaxID=586833 RepID=A0A667YBL7_9TELE|nr:tumor protein p53-inducible protein 13 [Myripristis murdjan]
MRSQTTSPPVTVTVLAALWVSVGRCGTAGSPWPRCDSGKFSLEKDLPQDALWDCPGSTWPVSTERSSSIDTVYDPEPARQVCMDKRISYNHTIPNSGAYRPVKAESGEYLYCPPQRWLNNLHHGATVLLYHPCAALRERLLLSVLARSCLSDYILTLHPELKKQTPVALVSWGRTLELPTVATSDICSWLETTTTTGSRYGDVWQTRKYDLLLTWPAEKHLSRKREQQYMHLQTTETKESVRQCCEQTLFPLLDGGMDAELQSRKKRRSMIKMKEEKKRRQSRAVIRENQENAEDKEERENTAAHGLPQLTNQTSGTIFNITEKIQIHSKTSEPSAEPLPRTRTSSEASLRANSPGPRDAPFSPESEISNKSASLLVSGASKAMLTPAPRGSTSSEPKLNAEPENHSLTPPAKPLQSNPEPPDLKYPNSLAGNEVIPNGVSSEHSVSTKTETPHWVQGQAALPPSKENAIEDNTDITEQGDKVSAKCTPTQKDFDKDNIAHDKMKDNEVVDVKEREVEHNQTQSNTHIHSKTKKTGFDSASQTQSLPDLLPQNNHRLPQPASYLPNTHDCGDCDPDGHCDCAEASGTQDRAGVLSRGMPRTPRTDEAVWAAAALGFLLVLLALSVLHTRLYRHWRTTPSLYWHDPRQDYDSVADVIRRRLKIAKTRRKRGRRQECVLLPSSTSSDEEQWKHP